MVCVPAVAVELLPPSYGDDGEKGRADDAGISSAPCNGGLSPQPQPERNEGGEAQPPSDGQAESRALYVMPVAFAAAPSCAVAPPANGSMEDGKHIADSLNVAGKSSQLVRDDGDVTGNGDGRVVESRAEDGELDREKDESRQKRWSASVLNPPPKRRAVSAKRKFPPGCGRDAVTSSGLGGSGASPVLRPDNSNHGIEGKSEEVGGATEAHNQKIQESRVVKCVALDDFAGGQNRHDHLRNDVGCGASPILRRDGFNEEMERKIEETGGATEAHNQKIQEWQVVKCVALDGFAGGQNSRDRLRNDVGCGASPILRRDDFNEEMERKIEEAGGATEAHNQKIQELQVVKCVALDDFAGSQNSRDRLQNDVGCGASPILRRDDFNEEMERKIEEAGGATEAHNQKIQEWQVVKCVALDDFAGGQNSRDRLRNDVGCGASPILRREEMEGNVEDVGGAVEAHNQKTQESQVVNVVVLDGFAGGQHVPRHGFFEKMYDRRLLRERKRTPLVVRNGEMRSKLEGRLHEGTSRTHSRGPLNVKGKGSEIVNINVTLLDDVGFLRDGVVSNKTSSTLRDVVCLPSKCGHHVATNQIEDKDSVGLTTNRIIVQALMAPDQSPWTQRMKSIGSVSKSLAPRNNVKKKIVTPRKKSRSKVTPSTSARDGAREDGEDFSSEDAENSLGLLVHENNNESCITLPQCTPSNEESVGTRSKVMKIDVRSRLRDRKPVSLVAEVGDVKTKREGGLQKGTSRTHVGALVNVKTKCKKPVNVKVNVTLLDDMRVSEDDKMRNQISRPRRGVARSSNNNMKKCMFGSKLKHDGISKGSLNKLMKESKCVDHIEENDNAGLVTNKGPVLALMAPEKCPWTQGKGTIAGVSQSLTCRNNSLTVREGLCLLDISQGKESIPICVINTIDDMLPMPFKYITKVIYPPSYEKASSIGCDCTNGCSDSIECACAVKNGGELPFNLNSAIIYTKPLIYECGPSCRCPPTCHNRVSQHGPKVPLELFKTGKTGWGVRSLSFIPSGSFICEYVGEVLQETEAERTENDEYLFDIGRDDDDDDDDDEEGSQSSKSEIAEESLGYTIDAAKCGNVGRFINHSCSPNMHAQDVLWDHDDKKMPHVMLFAEKNIRPLQELTYDYNYNIGNVHKNGKVKEKKCFCGSSKCRLRLY